MKTSEHAKELLATDDFEGCVLHIYKDSAGYPTIGIGHKLTQEERVGGKFTNGITKQQALDLCAVDLIPAENAVNSHVKVELSQNQFDAFVIFTFNIGAGGFASSSALTCANEGAFADVPAHMLLWDKITDEKTKKLVVCDGLITRRKNEIKIWNGTL